MLHQQIALHTVVDMRVPAARMHCLQQSSYTADLQASAGVRKLLAEAPALRVLLFAVRKKKN